mgnify:CR=1 FL=1
MNSINITVFLNDVDSKYVDSQWKIKKSNVIIEEGMDMFEGAGGTAERKGYSVVSSRESAEQNGILISRSIKEGHHAPWLEKEMPT